MNCLLIFCVTLLLPDLHPQPAGTCTEERTYIDFFLGISLLLLNSDIIINNINSDNTMSRIKPNKLKTVQNQLICFFVWSPHR